MSEQLLNALIENPRATVSELPGADDWAEKLLRWIAVSKDQIDADLSEVTTHWRIERLGAIERCVLRLGAAEMAKGMTPPKVVIQECVRLAERYGTEKAASFVNGVLDAHARRVGALA